jgi:hypothetical protein
MIAANSLQSPIAREGFAFVHGSDMRSIVAPFGSLDDWPAFVESWNHLEVDAYMADGGRYRRRRHAAYGSTRDHAPSRKPHQPHIQAPEYNPLHGGIVRWFEPIAPGVGCPLSPVRASILNWCASMCQLRVAGARLPKSDWQNASIVRIVAPSPTPGAIGSNHRTMPPCSGLYSGA